MGEIFRAAFDRVVRKFPNALRLADHLGTPDAEEPAEEILEYHRAAVRGELQVPVRLRRPPEEPAPVAADRVKQRRQR